MRAFRRGLAQDIALRLHFLADDRGLGGGGRGRGVEILDRLAQGLVERAGAVGGAARRFDQRRGIVAEGLGDALRLDRDALRHLAHVVDLGLQVLADLNGRRVGLGQCGLQVVALPLQRLAEIDGALRRGGAGGLQAGGMAVDQAFDGAGEILDLALQATARLPRRARSVAGRRGSPRAPAWTAHRAWRWRRRRPAPRPCPG